MKNNKLTDCIVLQFLIFAYFWAMGTAITKQPNPLKWKENQRFVWVLLSAGIGTAGSIAYLKNDNNERK